MLGLIGKKICMTSYFNELGYCIPCTVIKAGPCTVLQKKSIKQDGYSSIQLGYEEKKKKNTNKPLVGHFKKFNSSPKKRIFEFAGNFLNAPGDVIKVDLFQENDNVDIVGIAKGKGFQGVVKRHGFSGVGEKTHGQHNRSRAPGSIGAGSDPSRVFKGTRMAGRMGGKRITIKNLKILKIYLTRNLVLVKGAIPGPTNSYLLIKKTCFKNGTRNFE
ncbi:50S ribosomal protein L3 [Candidatus Karelsulcia muelleri]|uniref:50S ribosomal protein L3 n=1 Tax=Candidatus Karelsulcia muelleri TaxID=336810 RepID=UPI0023648DB1|nr:50S ribosomal protein L3 [Candidatus Karelsulcia muelleri]WDE42245.1 50S ribosomal protein L3 [Candidatus Karelsulcia muelleri]WDR79092.1 50S ribosomal protein L3 [Candidatus Karelsulcia muelleri]